MGDIKVDSTLYKQMVGKLIYLTNIIHDILFDVGIVSHYMFEPQVSHLNVIKHIFRYFRRTTTIAYSTRLKKTIHYKHLYMLIR